MAIQLATRSKALNVWTADELSYGRIAPSGAVPSDLDFKFQEGQGFVAVTRLAHYHNGFRFVLGDQLAGMAADTANERTRALAAEAKVAADLVTESARAVAAEAKVAADLADEVQRAVTTEGTIISSITSESTERKNADTAAATALALERSQREAADSYLTGWFNGELTRLNEVDTYLTTRADSTNASLNAMNQYLLDRITGVEQIGAVHANSADVRITEITTQQLPNLSNSIANETARATQIENDLQQQITNLLANTDATALNSLAELVADYSANGSGVNSALQAALVRIDQLEATVAALQASGDGGSPPVE
jgi:hypothetical protein